MRTILAMALALLMTALPRAGEAATVVFKFVSEPMVKVAEPPDFPDSYNWAIGKQYTVILKMITDDPSMINANFYWIKGVVGEDLPVADGGVTLVSATANAHGGGDIFNTLSITTGPDGKHHFDGYFAWDHPDYMFGDTWFGVGHGHAFLTGNGVWVKTLPIPLPAAGWLLLPALIALAAIRRRA